MDTTFIATYGHQLKMEQSFVWKMNAKKRNHLISTQLIPSKNNVLVGHVPIELLRLIYYFFKGEIGLVVPALHMATSDNERKWKAGC